MICAIHNPREVYDNPFNDIANFPCSVLAIMCAMKGFNFDEPVYPDVKVNNVGYCTLSNFKKALDNIFWVSNYKYYSPKERKSLREFDISSVPAIVCVKGHFLYVKDNIAYSFYDNLDDEVIAIWYLTDLNCEYRKKRFDLSAKGSQK